jgi:hypothetical protein
MTVRRVAAAIGHNGPWQLPILVLIILNVALVFTPGEIHASSKKKKVELPGPSDVVQKSRTVSVAAPADFRSTHFFLHTDLAPKQARELLGRLETMLGLISKYWNHPPSGTIELFVVDDLKHWPEGSLEAAGRAKIEQKAGITMTQTMSRGKRLLAAKSVVYAVADHGTPEHEAVHAFCGQAFGKTGPLWYAEGMAEMGQYWRENDTSVHCPDHVIAYLHASRAKPIREIIADDGTTRPGNAMAVTGDSWQNYAWRWALCHMLANNTNYAPRFRPLGLGFLTGQPVSFADTYGAMMSEIDFEYEFFIRHVDQGYRVDLCSWDWKRKFRAPDGSSSIQSRIAANRGWQPSGVVVSSDKKYDYSASGGWQTAKDATALSADGAGDSRGRLEGVIFNNFTLGEPFPLGAYGTFTPPGDGRMYLRCSDAWNELADNKGQMTVKIKNSGQGNPLARPIGATIDATNAADED